MCHSAVGYYFKCCYRSVTDEMFVGKFWGKAAESRSNGMRALGEIYIFVMWW